MSSSCDCSSQGVEADEGEVLLVGQAVHEVGGVPGLLHLHMCTTYVLYSSTRSSRIAFLYYTGWGKINETGNFKFIAMISIKKVDVMRGLSACLKSLHI